MYDGEDVGSESVVDVGKRELGGTEASLRLAFSHTESSFQTTLWVVSRVELDFEDTGVQKVESKR